MADQAARLAYAHGSAFTTEPLERYAAEVAPHLPMADPAIYPVSGGSEAIETALKLARATQLARGEPDRLVVFARWGSYHGNTLGALDLSGRRPLRRPYEGWLGRFRHVSAAYPYRGDDPGSQALGTTQALVDELDQAFTMAGPGTVAAFVAEPIVGATLGAVEPPKGYWPAVADVCRRHGALLIADEVMTGFGRTGEWFGLTHYAVQPDLLVAAKGATSGYWPFGFVAASGEVYDAVTGRRAVRARVHLLAPAHRGGRRARGAAHPRARVADPGVRDQGRTAAGAAPRAARREPGGRRHPRTRACSSAWSSSGTGRRASRIRASARLVEAIVSTARERGLLLYSGTGNANGVDGDTILLGPPFVVTDAELTRIADGLAEAIEAAVAAVGEPAPDLSASATGRDAVSSPTWSKSRRPTPSPPAPVVDPAAGPPGRGRRRLVAAIAVALLAVGGVAAVLVATGRLGQPAKPAARVALVDPDGALAIVDGQGGNRVVHAPAGTAFRFPAWSPDGTRVAAVANTDDRRGHPGVLDRDRRLGVAGRHRRLPERRIGAVLPVLDARRTGDHVPDPGGRQPRAALRAG